MLWLCEMAYTPVLIKLAQCLMITVMHELAELETYFSAFTNVLVAMIIHQVRDDLLTTVWEHGISWRTITICLRVMHLWPGKEQWPTSKEHTVQQANSVVSQLTPMHWTVVIVSVVSLVIGQPTPAIALDLLPSPPVTSAAAPTTDIQTISWAFTANRFRHRVGEDITLFCPPQGVENRVWGSDMYGDQSSICTAAVHAGLITFDVGGAIAIRILPGQDAYEGTTQNDVTSSTLGQWPGSFTFTTLRDAIAGIVQQQNEVGIPIQVGSWQLTAESFTNQPDQTFAVYCPAFGTVSEVWGSDIYRDASSICSAAVHAGRISIQAGGTVTFVMVPQMPFYIGNTRHGVTSRHWQNSQGSFQFLSVENRR